MRRRTSRPYAPTRLLPTRSVGLAYMTSGAKTVIPPHMSGPDSAGSSFSGSGMVQAQCARTWVAKPAAMTDDGRLHLRAKVMVSRKALVTVHIAARVPADADVLSDLESLGFWTDCSDPTHNF